jgi:hypothetical protein
VDTHLTINPCRCCPTPTGSGQCACTSVLRTADLIIACLIWLVWWVAGRSSRAPMRQPICNYIIALLRTAACGSLGLIRSYLGLRNFDANHIRSSSPTSFASRKDAFSYWAFRVGAVRVTTELIRHILTRIHITAAVVTVQTLLQQADNMLICVLFRLLLF